MKWQIQIHRRCHQCRGHARSRKYLPTLYLHLQIYCDTTLHVRALTRRTNIEFTSGKIRVQIPGTIRVPVLTRLCTCTTSYRVSRDACRIFERHTLSRDSDELIHMMVLCGTGNFLIRNFSVH